MGQASSTDDSNPDLIRSEISKSPEDDKLYNRLGNYYFRIEKNFREAINQYRIAVVKNPNAPVYFLNIADSYSYLKDYEQAIIWYNKFLQFRPNDDLALNSVGVSYYLLGRYDQAIQYYKLAIDRNPTPTYLVNLGDVYMYKRLFQDAIDKYETALIIDEKSDFALAALADAYERLYKLNPADRTLIEKAIRSYEKATVLNPNNNLYFSRAGDLNYISGNYDKAIEFYKKATELDKRDATSFANIGYVYFAKRNYEEALKNYDISLEIEPNNPTVLKYKGDYYKDMKQYDKAINFYNQILDKFPDSTDVITELALIYSSDDPSVKNIQKALSLAKAAVEKNPDNYLVYDLLGRIYSRIGEYEEAMASYQEALKLNDKDEVLYISLGEVSFKKANFREAIDYFNRALSLNHNNATAYDWLSYVYTKLKRWDEGERFANLARESAIKTTGSAELYDERMAILYHQQGLEFYNRGQYEEAIAVYEKANRIQKSNVTYFNMYLAYFILKDYRKALDALESAIGIISPNGTLDYENLKAEYEKAREEVKGLL